MHGFRVRCDSSSQMKPAWKTGAYAMKTNATRRRPQGQARRFENGFLLLPDRPSRRANFPDQYAHRANADPIAETLGSAQLLRRLCRVFPRMRHSCNTLAQIWALAEWRLHIPPPRARLGRVSPEDKQSPSGTQHC